jgi:hypothetical protein
MYIENDKLLESFLLATAQEEWERWYNSTRWIFADFVEERLGKEREALELRTMNVKISDDVGDGLTRAFNRLILRSDRPGTQKGEDEPVVFLLRFHELANESVICTSAISRRACCNWRFAPPLLGKSFCIECRSDSGEPFSYELRGDRGSWLDTLSLERAQVRCRRRVLEMFPENLPRVRYLLATDVEPSSVAAMAATLPDDSPRWVPYEIGSPESTLQGAEAQGARIAYERERLCLEAFLSDDPFVVGGDPAEPKRG